MTPLNLRPPTLDEIVFEGRNQEYGAFQLRQLYHRHLQRAFLIAVSLFLLLAVLPIIVQHYFTDQTKTPPVALPVHKPTILDNYKLPDEVKPAAPKASPAPARATPTIAKPVPDIPTRVVPNDQVIDKPVEEPTVQPAGPAVAPSIGTVDGKGVAQTTTPGDGTDTTGAGPIGSTGTGTKPAPFISVEEMPEFVGGQEALVKYLRRNLKYPMPALREHVSGKVFMAFTINPNGDIVDVEVLRGPGFGTEEEATRVIKNMPRWKPGKQNKQAVPVRYTLPITFSLGD